MLEDSIETDPINAVEQEWHDALAGVVNYEGSEFANTLLANLIKDAQSKHKLLADLNSSTVYLNTNYTEQELDSIESLDKLMAVIRWNAAVMVVKANTADSSLGGHIGTYSSSAYLYEVGFNYFWQAASEGNSGDLIYFQGHASPGIYSRGFSEGRFDQEHLDNFRRERVKGLSSYPHPRLMPNYWQFPTVSMGLGPLAAIYRARFMKYMISRELIPAHNNKIWCFCGDGEMDEPESLGALSIAAREKLDNLIFVINCNLQRLDGPVRGNGKIISELERIFVGNGWKVIKNLWGKGWNELVNSHPKIYNYFAELVDGEFQNFSSQEPEFIKQKLLEYDPSLQEHLDKFDFSQEFLLGGVDPKQVYSAYSAAVASDSPVVILAHTVKGYGLGSAGEGMNTAHNTKKMTKEQLIDFKNRFKIPVTEQHASELEYCKLDPSSSEFKFMTEQRQKLGGSLPTRMDHKRSLLIPEVDIFQSLFTGTGSKEMSTTMAFVRILNQLLKNADLKKFIVPIVPDESRTFGMEGLFRQIGIYSPHGQNYTPVDAKQIMFYKESASGQMLQEGINEAGAFASWLASATSYSVNDQPTLPFYIYYSMFGFQRIGDLAWAAGDSNAKGFLIGATAGRTTLNGEGLQHEDGHSHIMSATIPNCISYDPCFSYELAVIIHHGMKTMYEKLENKFFYITVMNENYSHPKMPEDAYDGIVRGMYKLPDHSSTKIANINLLGSGTILREVIKAAEYLNTNELAAANVWSVTSFTELAREGQRASRKEIFLDADGETYVNDCLGELPTVAATDYVRAYSEQIRPYVRGDYLTLGTDGFGRSDTRANLRDHFEVSWQHIVLAAMKLLVKNGNLDRVMLQQTRDEFKLNLIDREYSLDY